MKWRCERLSYSANNGVTIALTKGIHELTSRLILTKEKVNDGFTVHVIVQVSLSVVDELNDHLIGARVETDGTDVGGLKIGRLEEHVKQSKCTT